MSNKNCGWRVWLAIVTLSASGMAKADWLAADPGTPISLQMNTNWTLVVRPLGGTWTHPVCGDVSAAVFRNPYPHYPLGYYGVITEMLIAAAANGSLVNVFAEAEECDANGHPVIRNVRIQAP